MEQRTTERGLRRLWKPIIAVCAVLAAFTITFVEPQTNGLANDIDPSDQARAAQDRDPYDLTQLRVLNRTILEVKDHYVEPQRVDPQHMLLAGLNAIQRGVAPVLVHYEPGDPSLTVQVNDDRQDFRVDDVDAPWSLAARFREIFGFLQTHLQQEEGLDLRDVEYAAVNGMLQTLDPHTVLLTPDVFEEMQMNTRGEFGGLGIVISLHEGHLTIMRPMDNTPASEAGLQRMDRIVKINEESTLNMPLSEAVDRLRGPPGSNVTVWIARQRSNGTYGAPQRVELVRAVIQIESVHWRMLEDGVGYIKIDSFQARTFDMMHRGLSELHRQDLRGLILDLRDNPGGLLEAAVKVANTFLESGTIVTTSSNDPSQRDEKFATRDGTEPNYPMIVLVDGASASASEIVAGALKNHDRALVVGQTTFGKGSVQVLHNFEDGSALKLTIAQYLTPGDISIQGVGIVPDIGIDSMTVDREDMDLMVDRAHIRESDLQSHLTHESAHAPETPARVLRYYLPPDVRQRLRDARPEEGETNEEEEEFLTRFSRTLLTRATTSNRREMLAQAQGVIEQAATEEFTRAVDDLRQLGIDWSAGSDQGPTTVQVVTTTSRPNNEVIAGQPFELRVRVTNTGDQPLYRLRGTTESDYSLFDDRELVFGRLNPGDTREWSTTLGICEGQNSERTCTVPKNTPDRADGIRIAFHDEHGHAPEPAEIRTVVRALPRPQFAYAVHVADDLRGNGDGRIQRGERVSIYVRVKNVGEGRTFETQANLRNSSGRGVLLQAGRFQIDNLQPGDERFVQFTFEVLEDFDRDEAKFEISIVDVNLRESVVERVLVPIHAIGTAPQAQSGHVVLRDGAIVRQAPDANGEMVAVASDGAVRLPRQATLGSFVRVDLGESEPGWVASSDLVSSGGGGRLSFPFNHMPPRLEVQLNTLVTRDGTIRVQGTATDEEQVRDMYIFSGRRKSHYQSNRNGDDDTRMTFDTQVPLRPGINYLTVYARQRDDIVSQRIFVVRRDGPNGELLETPDFADTPWESGAAGELEEGHIGE